MRRRSPEIAPLTAHRPAVFVVVAACVFSAGPLVVGQMAGGSDPFVFNAVVRAAHALALLIFLAASILGTFGQDMTISKVLGSDPAELSRWWHSSLWLMVAGSFHYAFFAWSISHIDPAVTTTIYEIRHLIMIAALAFWASRDARTAGSSPAPALAYRITRRQSCLALLLPVGVGCVILGQTDGMQGLSGQHLDTGLPGVPLALTATLLAGIHPAAALIYGKRTQPRLPSERRAKPGTDAAQLQALWCTVFGHVTSGVVTIPLNLVLGLLGGSERSIDTKGILGAVVVGGLLFGGGGIMLLWANHRTSRLSINSAFYATPILALIWLSLVGIALPRFGLFVVGASLTVGTVILIQADSERASRALFPRSTQFRATPDA